MIRAWCSLYGGVGWRTWAKIFLKWIVSFWCWVGPHFMVPCSLPTWQLSLLNGGLAGAQPVQWGRVGSERLA